MIEAFAAWLFGGGSGWSEADFAYDRWVHEQYRQRYEEMLREQRQEQEVTPAGRAALEHPDA
jgi:hypothetical protein